MTKSELIEAIQGFPNDTEVMIQFDPFSRWDIAGVFYDKERNTIVIVVIA